MRRKGQQAEKDETERVTGLGRRTREEIAKWNQMTALRFQTGGETSDIPGLPSEGRDWYSGITAYVHSSNTRAHTHTRALARAQAPNLLMPKPSVRSF